MGQAQESQNLLCILLELDKIIWNILLRYQICYSNYQIFKSSCPEAFCKKGILKNFVKSNENTRVKVSF